MEQSNLSIALMGSLLSQEEFFFLNGFFSLLDLALHNILYSPGRFLE